MKFKKINMYDYFKSKHKQTLEFQTMWRLERVCTKGNINYEIYKISRSLYEGKFPLFGLHKYR